MMSIFCDHDVLAPNYTGGYLGGGLGWLYSGLGNYIAAGGIGGLGIYGYGRSGIYGLRPGIGGLDGLGRGGLGGLYGNYGLVFPPGLYSGGYGNNFGRGLYYGGYAPYGIGGYSGYLA